MNNKNLCIAAIAHGLFYEGCVPIFLYSAAKTCPGATIKVFLSGEPTDSTREALVLLNNPLLEVITNEFVGYKVTSRSPAMWRGLLFTPGRVRRFFENFRYVYTTDVDLILCPEEPPLLEQHLRHCEAIGLPYSGFVRVFEPLLVAGAVFCTEEYVDLVQDIVAQFDAKVRAKGEFIFEKTPRHPDERIAYQIAELSGLPPLPQLKPYSVEAEFDLIDPAMHNEQLFSPHHGIHLGLSRSRSISAMRKRFGNLLGRKFYEGYFRWLLEQKSDPLFQQLLALMPETTANTVRRMLFLAKEYVK